MSLFNFRNEFDGVEIGLDSDSPHPAGGDEPQVFTVTIEFEDGATNTADDESFVFDNITDAYAKFQELVKIEIEAVMGEFN